MYNEYNKGSRGVKDSLSTIEERREQLQFDINRHKVEIDRNVFKKTKSEKERVKKERLRYKNR